MSDIWIVGASMTPFARYPADVDLIDLAYRAATDAMADAGVRPTDLGALAFGSAYEGGGNPGQRLSKQLGQTGVPTWNVINVCATGAAAFRICHLAVKAGEAEVAPRRRRRENGQDRAPRQRRPGQSRSGVVRPFRSLRVRHGHRGSARDQPHARGVLACVDRVRAGAWGYVPPLRQGGREEPRQFRV